jgi:hypothetical protein
VATTTEAEIVNLWWWMVVLGVNKPNMQGKTANNGIYPFNIGIKA